MYFALSVVIAVFSAALWYIQGTEFAAMSFGVTATLAVWNYTLRP